MYPPQIAMTSPSPNSRLPSRAQKTSQQQIEKQALYIITIKMPPRAKSSKRAADFDSDDEAATSKKTKATSSTTTNGGAQVDAEGNPYWEVGHTRVKYVRNHC